MIFLKEFFEEIDFEKNQQMTKKSMEYYPAYKELNKTGFITVTLALT